jgi:hypothetical protein
MSCDDENGMNGCLMKMILAESERRWCAFLLIGILLAVIPHPARGERYAVTDLATQANGGQLRSWEPSVTVVPGHEAYRANDGSLRTFWVAEARDLPADLGIEWPTPQEISCVIIRYRSKTVIPTPTDSRTQPFARLQWWDGTKWNDLDAHYGGEVSRVARYTFPPVKTTRIRAVFEELPIIAYLPGLEDPGIYVSELEAYARPTFQEIDFWKPAGHYVQNTGSLIIEPKRTRVFSDVLTPTLIVAESDWAMKRCAVSTPADKRPRLENGFLQLDLSVEGVLAETSLANCVSGETVRTPQAETFIIRTDGGELRSRDFQVKEVSTKDSTPEIARLRVDLSSSSWDAAVCYELRQQDHFYHKWLTLTPKGGGAVRILDVTVSALRLPRPLGISAGESQELSYPVTILDQGGFFSCVEAVQWDHRGDEVSYYPGAALKPGETFTSEKAAVGVFKKRGEIWHGLDRGVREWLIEYHAQVSPISWCWPDVYCEGWSAKVGLEEVKTKPEWLAQYMKNAARIGIRFMDAYEPVHHAMDAPEADVNQWVLWADQNRISTGWWLDHSLKYRGQSQKHPPFRCCLSPEAERYYQDVVEFIRAHHLKAFHWGDFLQIMICNETDHGHLPGKYSLYPQAQRILQLGRDIRATDPHVRMNADMGWFNPQWTRFVDSGAHIDSFDARAAIEPDLHLDRLYADMNRRYMQIAHGVFLHPWYRNLNCVTHYGQETRHHDRAGFRYALLSALGVAGQLVFNDAPDNTPDSEYGFSQRWIAWASKNKDYLRQGDILFDRSARYVKDSYAGDAECMGGFAHIRKDRGFIFLMNPTACEQIADLKLAFEAPEDQRFQVDEVYPGGCSLRGPDEGFYRQGGSLRATVPAKQVRILWIAPAPTQKNPQPFRPEDFRAEEFRRYTGNWKIVERTENAVRVKSSFSYPASARAWLTNSAAEAEWSKEPWAHDKAYLVLLFNEENRDPLDLWVNSRLFVAPANANPAPEWVRINGIPKAVVPFQTARAQEPNVARCFFVSLGEETKLGEANEVEVLVWLQSQLIFSGAYLDLPDQMPEGDGESAPITGNRSARKSVR